MGAATIEPTGPAGIPDIEAFRPEYRMKPIGKRPEGASPPVAKTAGAPSSSEAPSAAARSVLNTSSGGGLTTNHKVRAELREKVFTELFDVVNMGEVMEQEDDVVARKQVGDLLAQLVRAEPRGLDIAEQDALVLDIVNDVLGLGPLESLLARDDIADIIIYGPNKTFIEVGGRLRKADVKFRDENHLMNVCQRIAGSVGRRVDESSPICDARLADGSRVAIVAYPISLDGSSVTIRKFKKEKLSLDDLVGFGSISKPGARILQIASTCRCNILVSGGTGSGKTTLLNCLTRYIDEEEAIITLEDAAELQLQQENVRRWETRPANLEGKGEIGMSMLVKASLRHRPERIIVGEVRDKSAFDLLQAMNTGHDGSMGTIHSNNPREALARMESLIAMSDYNLPTMAVRDQIASSINIVVQATRLRDGSRKIVNIDEVIGMEGDIVTLQPLLTFEYTGEDAKGRILGRHVIAGIRPRFWERARYYNLENDLMEAMRNGQEDNR